MRGKFQTLVGIALCLAAAGADAHGVIKGVTDFHAGLIHPVTALEHVLPIFVLGMLGGQHGLARFERVLWLFPLAVGIGACLAVYFPQLHGITLVNLLSAVVLGGLVAIARRLPPWLIAALAVFFGLTHGYANGAAITGQVGAPVYIAGVMLAVFLVVAYGMMLTELLLRQKPSWLPIAVRVVGSWTAAIGVLVLSISDKTQLFA